MNLVNLRFDEFTSSNSCSWKSRPNVFSQFPCWPIESSKVRRELYSSSCGLSAKSDRLFHLPPGLVSFVSTLHTSNIVLGCQVFASANHHRIRRRPSVGSSLYKTKRKQRKNGFSTKIKLKKELSTFYFCCSRPCLASQSGFNEIVRRETTQSEMFDSYDNWPAFITVFQCIQSHKLYFSIEK